MKLSALIILYLCIGTDAWKIFHKGRSIGGNVKPPSVSTAKLPPDEWFEQKLDHFNPTDAQTWKQRFFTNATHFNRQAGGPVFLMIGGEGEASPEWMVHGAWLHYAEKYNALCFQLEHRYYGKSQPKPDLSTKNLRYLTSEQALADLAYFITAMNKKWELPSDVKWVVFGGSYPGSLAAWMRMKYPHLVHGAMSASGPLLAQLDFKDYFKVVDESLATYSNACVEQVRTGTAQIEVLLKHMIGQRTVNEKFRLCDPIEQSIDNANDVSNLYETLSGNFANVVQYNKDNRVGKSSVGGNITIDVVCAIMTNDSLGSAMERLAAVNSLTLDTYGQHCLDYRYDKMVRQLQNTSLAGEGARQWTYQTCTEFGFYQTSTYSPHVFSDRFPVEFFVQQCADVFSSKFDRSFLESSIDWTNAFYGALSLQVTNVVFVHGSIDPWHALGITNSTDPDAPSIYIEGTAHCANMYPISPHDPPQLTRARLSIQDQIGKWLSR